MHRLASISVSNPQGSPSYLRGAQPLNIQPNLPIPSPSCHCTAQRAVHGGCVAGKRARKEMLYVGGYRALHACALYFIAPGSL